MIGSSIILCGFFSWLSNLLVEVSSDSLKVAVKTAGSIGTSTANAVTADVSVDLVWGQF